jgi:DNA-binding NtrC family response regulator
MVFNRFSQMTRKSTNRTDEVYIEAKPLIEVIDDDPRIREGLKLNLQKTYQVRLCADGEEGISSVNEEVYVVILDIKMPGKNGLQVYEAIKAKFPDLPIIFYSAYQSVLEGAKLSQQYKPFNYIDKSANIQELLGVVERAVQYSQTIRNLANTEYRLQEMRKEK